MKVHIFLLIGDARGSYPEPILYAFTTNKSLYKAFKETRDMNSFIYKEVGMTEEKYNQFARNYSKRNLIRTTMTTKNDNGEPMKIGLVVTYSEEEHVFLRSDTVYYELSKYTNSESVTLSDEILTALNMLKYFDICRFFRNMDNENYYSLQAKLSSFDFTLDQMETFLFFFGYTMKK